MTQVPLPHLHTTDEHDTARTPPKSQSPRIASTPALAARQQKKPRLRQWMELAQLVSRCHFQAKEYALYGFDEVGRTYEYMLNFLPVRVLRNRVAPLLNEAGWKPLLDNKWLFYTHFHSLGVPVTEVFGLYYRGMGLTRHGAPLGSYGQFRQMLDEERPEALVIKPAGGIMGRKLLIIDEIRRDGSAITYVDNRGETMSESALREWLDTHPAVHYYASGYELWLNGYLIEAKVRQHQLLARLAPATTNTVRVVTFLTSDSEVDVHFAVLRLGRRGAVADNWDRGGVSVGIDLGSGELRHGVFKPKHGGEWTDTHPDTGIRFTGLRLPFWNEVLDVCRRAARAAPGLRSVGWDVVITANGPVIIEGNPDWGVELVQVHTDGYLQPAVRAQFAEFGVQLPAHSLPRFSVVDAWRYWRNKRSERQAKRRTETTRRSREGNAALAVQGSAAAGLDR